MRIIRHAHPLGLLAALLLAACDSPSTPPPPPPVTEEPSIEWLRANAVPFASTAPGAATADLAPLGQMIGSARIVGLGEATHGTREFFDMKHRIVRYLVLERGFRVFGIEATWAEANAINRYVHTGEGSPDVLLSNLQFWTWNTREVLELILWMREHNQSVPADERVSFYGFDLQYSRVAMDDVVAYLDGVDAAAADSARAYYTCYRAFQDPPRAQAPSYIAAPDSTRARCREGVRAAHALLAARAAAYVPQTGRMEYETALRTARVLVQNEELRANPGEGTAIRDRYMAENVAWLAEVAEPDAGIVLWAHNAHVSRWAPYMGTHLTQRFGDDYVVAGFTFHHGQFNAVRPGAGLGPATAPNAIINSYEYNFDRLGHARFLVDLRPARAAGAPAAAAWLRGGLKLRLIGASYNPERPDLPWLDRRLAEEYDVMIHITETTPTRLLPFR